MEDLNVDLEKIFNERTSALTQKIEPNESLEGKEGSQSAQNDAGDADEDDRPKKRKKKSVYKLRGAAFTQIFDGYLLRILEAQLPKSKVQPFCPDHVQEAQRDCFECSLINLACN